MSSIAESGVSQFDSYALDYETALGRGIAVSGENAAYFAKGRVAWLAGCLQSLGFKPQTVLDFGCGTGTATPYFLDVLAARAVIGVDLSQESLKVARRTHAEPDKPASFMLTHDYMPGGDVDLAYCNGVFHHVPIDERPSVVQYIADSLAPGGMFALWENNPFSPAARYVMSRIPFDRDAVLVWPNQARRLVEGAGLRTIRTDFCFIFPRLLSGLRRVERYLARIPLGAQYQVLAQKPTA